MLDSLLCCIECGGNLKLEEATAQCLTCHNQWPALLGIPDFRERTGEYVKRDIEQAEKLAASFSSCSRNELVTMSVDMGSFYQDNKASARLRQQRIINRQQWQTNSNTITARLEQLQAIISFEAYETIADIGCGSGSQLPALSGLYQSVVGMDASLSELVLAKKLLEEEQITNVVLACAFAEQMPIKSGKIDFAIALYVIEHVNSASQSVEEIRRILKPGGHFYFAVPYRYTCVPPEPHTHIWWVGWLPRKWQAVYVNLFKPDFDFNTIHLFSFGEIHRLSASTGQNILQFFNPGFDSRFPPINQQRQAWKILRKSNILLTIAKIFFRKSIHAVMTRSPKMGA